MKAHYKTKSGRIVIEVDGQTVKELFRGIAEVQEVFEAESECGCCAGHNLKFSVRTSDGNEFYELVCEDCTAQFSFGQKKDGKKIFPKRQGQAHGWKVWRPGGAQPDVAEVA